MAVCLWWHAAAPFVFSWWGFFVGGHVPGVHVHFEGSEPFSGRGIHLSGVRSIARQRHPVEIDGKFFSVGGERFPFHGVTYGTFQPRADGERYPSAAQVDADFTAMRSAGFTVVRTYTMPPDDVIESAALHGLRLLSGVLYPDWRYLVGASRADRRRLARDARATV